MNRKHWKWKKTNIQLLSSKSKIMKNTKYILSIAVLGFSLNLFGQKELPSGKIEVIKNFDARLAESEKLELTAPYSTAPSKDVEYDYQVIAKDKITVDVQPPTIKPVAVSPEKSNDKSYKHYVKAGYGFPASPLVEANFALVQKPGFSLDLLGRHYSANDKKIEWQRFSDTDLGLNLGYDHKKGIGINGDIGYTINSAYLYGYNHDSLQFSKENAQKKYTNTGLGLKFYNTIKNKIDVDYWAHLKYDNYRDNLATRENDIVLDFGVKKYLNQKHPIKLAILSDVTNVKDTLNQDLNNFIINPSFTYQGDGFSAKLGMRIALLNDHFYFLPDVELNAKIVQNKWIIFAGWEGNYLKNTYKTLSRFNPYIHSRQIYKNTKLNDIYAGFRGNVWDLQYEAKAGYRQVDDLAYFVQHKEDSRFFKVGYDTATVIFIHGQVGTQVLENLSATATVIVNSIDPKNEAKPWMLPTLQFNLSAKYKALADKLTVKADLFFGNGMSFKLADGTADKGNPLFDVSIGGDYMFSENFGAFIMLNNLAFNKYKVYQDYPTFGLNAVGGIIARF